MKFMKLGTRPDTFYTEEAARTVLSEVQPDLTIRINNVTYLLHKHYLLPKCGLLQRLLSEKDNSTNVVLDLHDFPGGEEAFETCAKFCYGITISLSAHNFVPAFCAAKFLRMTEGVENGNFVVKLESFFTSCILEGWKDTVVALQNTERVYEWSENLGIVRRCIESIVDKILTPPAKVTWSYTYTRPGYDRKRHQSVPKDWWTEDISFLYMSIFRCIISVLKSTNTLQPQLIGEALHVYASRWLLDNAEVDDSPDKKRKILETIVSLIPGDKGSVSVKFLLKLLRLANFLGVSPLTKTELLRLSGLQLDEATLDDLLVLTRSNDDRSFNDIGLVKNVLDSFLRQWRRKESVGSIHKVGKLYDSYLQVVAKDSNISVQKMVSLIEALPGIARPEHNDLYKAINIYLKAHPDLSKTERKQLCRVLDCQKLAPQVRAHAVKNERLPLRTVVQVLFFEQDNDDTITKKHTFPEQPSKDKDKRLSEPGTSGVHQDLRELKPETSLKTRPRTNGESTRN
ncbi:hypothetical protein CDL12_14114 [Handroanthus impetiginosus]|uniref:NPH3 domain-containing protein n=1 Tax=Handroanthus impetiginosus TaxID=429701 RepID=A0A2G9H6W7_9LAMI|nr:hypothetical protein CDL12_14114 [Handroanthus impetiginosus]